MAMSFGGDVGPVVKNRIVAPNNPTYVNKTATKYEAPVAYVPTYKPPAQQPAYSFNERRYTPPLPAPSYTPAAQQQPQQPAATTQSVASAAASQQMAQQGGASQSQGSSTPPVSAPVQAPVVAAPPPAPEPPPTITVPDAKADSTYQAQVSALARSLTDSQAQSSLAGSQYDRQYGAGLKNLGYNQAKKSFDPRGHGSFGQAFQGNEGDFAGRGVLHSGLYAQSNANLSDVFNQRVTDMGGARGDFQDARALQDQQAQSANSDQKGAALQDAISRIVAQYGIKQSQVPVGTGPKTMPVPSGR